jgi:hypothetical protein
MLVGWVVIKTRVEIEVSTQRAIRSPVYFHEGKMVISTSPWRTECSG